MPRAKKREQLFDRVPPQDIEAEKCVLGSIFLDNNALLKVVEFLNPGDFYRAAHGAIYRTMLELFNRNEPIDLVTVHAALKERDLLEQVGGAAYLAELAELVPTAANVVYYANIVREKSILRRLIMASTEIVTRCYEGADPVDDLLEEAERAIFEIRAQGNKRSFFPLKEVIKDAVLQIEQLHQRREEVTGVPTGFYEFDRLTAGLQNSDLIIVAGRPSMGKTSFALNIAHHAAVEHGIPVGIFSLEMSKEQLAMRMLCADARVDAQALRTGKLTDADWQRLTYAANRLSKAPIFIDDTAAISVLELRAKARRLMAEHGLGLIIIDYLQLMRGKERRERREQEISEISSSLKAMAKELNVPVVALSQLNRRVEERPDKRPQLSDLRESGAIEQDADVILFIYRDEVYKKDTLDKGIAEIIIGKQRNGPTGVVRLAFLSQYSTFANLDEDHQAAMAAEVF
ncbi:replicative DNA helicase [Thermodesulfatator indicus DSM 15286]|uniref:Replicative DNA helicase n=1 Tax=Thermodesulfatator indicus (strain DSM 15286 / JCM 11887 / CIR29812) TaxID=667014 RepID=F8ABF1_THEID|nr:replicative DNA helicase [Thermodesulfatator indicus]AEH44462.1 replicative DNA helicase [Thermodesulfatator indicus DSM 15286]